MTFLAYYGFAVTLDSEDIVITRGLLEKKRMTVPLKGFKVSVLLKILLDNYLAMRLSQLIVQGEVG